MTTVFAADLDDMEVGETIVDPIEEAREEWMRKRHGKITCSKFGVLIGAGKGKDKPFTESGLSYLRQVAAERLGSFVHSGRGAALDWGTNLEAFAVQEYSARTNQQIDGGQFKFFQKSEYIGGTPDGLVGEDGCIEVKCPYDPGVHVKTLITREVPTKPINYLWQCYGHLYVTGRQWCDFISFDPRIDRDCKLCVIRVERDESRMKFLEGRLNDAVALVEQMTLDATK